MSLGDFGDSAHIVHRCLIGELVPSFGFQVPRFWEVKSAEVPVSTLGTWNLELGTTPFSGDQAVTPSGICLGLLLFGITIGITNEQASTGFGRAECN